MAINSSSTSKDCRRKEGERYMGSGGWVLRALLGAAVFFWVLFLWFSSVGSLANHAATRPSITISSTRYFKHWKLIGAERLRPDHQDLHLNYVSKRRVPNGPDPIHNRRAVKSRQPPGRV